MAKGAARTGPKYRQIADDLRDRIAAGEYDADSQLPAKKALMARYGAALATVDAALDVLRQEGRIETVQGSGTFLRKPPEPEPSPELAAIIKRLEAVENRTERLEGMEVNLMELYGKSGHDYPGQEQEHPGTSRKAQREQAG